MSMGERVPPAALLLSNTSLVVRHVLILALQSVFLSCCTSATGWAALIEVRKGNATIAVIYSSS